MDYHVNLMPDTKRNQHFVDLYKKGYSFSQIGRAYKLTRERVRQILLRDYGIKGRNNSSELHNPVPNLQRFSQAYGCLKGQAFILPLKVRSGYLGSKSNAKRRGIDWNISIIEWWSLWQSSGRWHERGTHGDKYCMCRINHAKGYSLSNVYIGTARENHATGRVAQLPPIVPMK